MRQWMIYQMVINFVLILAIFGLLMAQLTGGCDCG